MNAKDNKFLILGENAIMTPVIEPIIVALDKCFEEAGIHAIVTSGLRKSEDQLRIIRQFIIRKGLAKTYPDAMNCNVEDTIMLNGERVFKWQMAWSALLNAGIIINPAASAKLLMDYVGATGKNRKGDVFPPSNHLPGHAFDIGGGPNGVDDELKVVQKAMHDGKVPGIINIVVEHSNNCLHHNCR